MLILEVIAISSSLTGVCTGLYKFVKNIRSNRYAADYARVHILNQHERGKFSEVVVPKRYAVSGHTHGESAAARSTGTAMAEAYAYSIGKVPFYVSMSAADQRAGKAGDRIMHWSKDFNAEARIAKPTPESMLVMIDVDEHLDDLPKILHDHYLPTVLYTFQPSEASGTFNDYRFTFNKEGKVVYDVAGGGKYEHLVWDYSPDCLTMRRKFLGITYAKSYFTVEKRMIDVNHQLILLTPLAKFGLIGCFFSYRVKGTDLARLAPVQGDFIRLAIAKSRGSDSNYEHMYSTARVNTYNAATVTMQQDDALALAAVNSESKLSPFQVKSMIPGIENSAAVTLVDFHRLKKSKPAPRVVIPTDAVNNYTYNPVFAMDERNSVAPFMAPILPECYAPTQSVESDEAMVKGRITGIATEPKHLTEKEMKYAYEFADLLKKEIGSLEPVGHEEIVNNLNRPSQRRITDEASFADKISKTIKSFMKKESYQKPTDPRPIATINGKDKYEYSSFTYAVSEALKRTSWYAFGRKPNKIAERVATICSEAMHVILTDLSRFDGRVNLSLRQLEEIVMKALFPEKYWKQMLDLMRKQYGGKGITKLGVKYKNGYNRQSGSPETAIFNTICNAFMAYVTLREAGCEPAEAYVKLGLYGGDDGLTPNVDSPLYVEVAKKFGHVLEADQIKRGDKGVSFLARMYSKEVWYGDTNSCADIARALSKFHVTSVNNMEPVDKLFEKAYALYLTDAETPIIGDFVSRVCEVSGKSGDDYKNKLRIWNSDLPEEEQYPNANHDNWMNEIVVDQHLDGFRLHDFRIWLQDCKTMSDFLVCPAFIETPELKRAKVDIKVNDDLVVSEGSFEAALKAYLAKKGKGDAPYIKPSLNADVPSTRHNNSSNPLPNPMADTDYQPRDSRSKDRRRGADSSGSRGSSGKHSNGNSERPEPRRVGWTRPSSRTPKYRIRDGPLDGLSGKNVGTGTGSGSGPKTGPCKSGNVHVPIRPDHKKDLTCQGVEPNPGPVQSPPVDNAKLPYLDQFLLSQREPDSMLQSIGSLGQGALEIANELLTPITDLVYAATDPIVDRLSSQPNPRHRVATPSPRLVGVELNPGPVTLPVRGSVVKNSAGKGRQIAARLKQIAAAQRNRDLAMRSTIRKSKKQGNSVVTQPVAAAYASGLTNGKPIIIHADDDSVRIKHRELITVVNGTAAFTSNTFVMQPGLPSVFQWLSTQCVGWEKYRWNSLRATYYTRTGTSTPGSMLLVPDYDAADAAPTSEQQASTYHGMSDDAPWKTIVMNFDMRRSKELFIRSGVLAPNLDIKTYDFANLFVCTADGTTVNWGKVYIEYDVTLINSQFVAPGNLGGSVSSGGTMTTAGPLGTAPTITGGSFIAGATSTTITIQNLTIGQKYLWNNILNGTGLTAVNSAQTGFTAVAVINDLVNAAGTQIADVSILTATATSGTLIVSATGTTVTGGTQEFAVIAG